MKSLTVVLAVPLLVLTGCPREREELTAAEARQALEEASDAGQAEALTGASVDIATRFTLGQAVDEAATELRAFIAAQLPCAEVELEQATLRVTYGARAGNCRYRGHEFSGTHELSIERNEDASVEVHHEWIGFSNGVVTLDGTADVTWDFATETRRVRHESQWRHLDSGRSGTGYGDRVQTVLAGGLAEGILIDGSRAWDGELGHWNLAIDGVKMRWSDPVPEAGSYTLYTPFDKNARLSFDRVDEDTIRVTVAGRKREFSFTVGQLGAIAED